MALWVNKGKIEGAVSTRKGTWCLEEEIGDLKDRWVDYVMTWHPMRGKIKEPRRFQAFDVLNSLMKTGLIIH